MVSSIHVVDRVTGNHGFGTAHGTPVANHYPTLSSAEADIFAQACQDKPLQKRVLLPTVSAFMYSRRFLRRGHLQIRISLLTNPPLSV